MDIFSLGNIIDNNKNEFPSFEDEKEGYYGPFGVCDNIHQCVDHYAQFINNLDKNYCISFTPIIKSEQPSEGGWRWHKWGEYIGTQNPRQEYIYDEPLIEKVYCFHIYELLD